MSAVLAAAATVAVAAILSRAAALEFLGLILGVTAGVYLGFALVGGRQRQAAAETAGILFFVALAVVGLSGYPHVLALGFSLHILWDFAHHPNFLTTRIVHWYPPACLIYDGVVGIFILLWWR